MKAFVQIIAGLIVGGLILVIPFVVLFSGASGPEVPYILLPGTVISVAISIAMQTFVTAILRRSGKPFKWMIVGIWAIYPLLFVLYNSWKTYVDYRIELAQQHDYSARTIDDLQYKDVRSVLLVETGRRDHYYFRDVGCRENCLETLRTGVLSELIRPAPTTGLGFRVYRFATGKDCEVARKNFWRHEEVQYSHRSRLQALSSRAQEEKGPVEGLVPHAFEDSAKRPRLDTSATYDIAVRGHFDQCVTVQLQETVDYNVRIDFGRDYSRPYGPDLELLMSTRTETALTSRSPDGRLEIETGGLRGAQLRSVTSFQSLQGRRWRSTSPHIRLKTFMLNSKGFPISWMRRSTSKLQIALRLG